MTRYLLPLLLVSALPLVCAQELYLTEMPYSASGTVSHTDAGTGVRTPLVQGLVSPTGMALDAAAGRMYWMDFPGDIWASDLDGTHVEMVIGGLAHVPPPGGGIVFPGLPVLMPSPTSGMAVDSLAGKLYWTDLVSLYRADVDGSNLQVIPSVAGITLSGGMALDTDAGKLYYSGVPGGTPIDPIYRSNLDGTMMEVVYEHPTMIIGALALDKPRERIYFTDQTMGGVYRVSTMGTGMQTVHYGSWPVALAVDTQAEKVYWADQSSSTIHRCNLDGSSLEVVGGLGGSPGGLGLLQPPPAPPAPAPVCGDCSGDGTAPSILDALVAAQIAAGAGSPSPSCDVNGSGMVEILDALLIARFVAHLPANFTCP